MMTIPADFRYTHDHEWLQPQEARFRVGITRFAVDQLGDITLVDLPGVGELVTKGLRFGTVESVKSVSDLYAPVSGRVLAVNDALRDAPELVNNSPYGDGWMIEVEATEPTELADLMSAEEYSDHITASAH